MVSPNDLYVAIRATLPVCLHLDERSFDVRLDSSSIVSIRTQNFFSEEPTYLGTARNAEIMSDSFSHFRFTTLVVTIPFEQIEPIKPSEILPLYKDTLLSAVNKFVNAVRIVTNRHGLKNYSHFRDFYKGITAALSPALDERQVHVFEMPFGEGLTTAKPNRSKADHQRLETLLRADIPLPDLILSDARRELYYGNDLTAVLYSVIALEFGVSNAIRSVGLSKGIDKQSLDRMLMDVGLTGNLKTTLKLVCPNTAVMPEEVVFQKCKAAITFRNKIMHKGCRKIAGEDLSTMIDNIEIIVRFCEQIVSEDSACIVVGK